MAYLKRLYIMCTGQKRDRLTNNFMKFNFFVFYFIDIDYLCNRIRIGSRRKQK